MKITLIDNERSSLWYYPETKIVHHQFHTFVYGKDFRGILEKGLEMFQKHGACKWLSDDRGNSAVGPADTEWATNVWAPRVIAAGWKFWAVVKPRKVIGQMNIKQWIEMYAEKGVTVRAFTEPEEALRWLEEQ